MSQLVEPNPKNELEIKSKLKLIRKNKPDQHRKFINGP